MDDPATMAAARADLYELLATILDGDMETLATALRNGSLTSVAETMPIGRASDALDRDDVQPETLSRSYDAYFIVPGERYVPPIASAHCDDPSESFESDSPFHDEGSAGELLGDPAVAMSALYEEVGFQPNCGDFPDHAATQIEFLAAMSRTKAKRLDAGDSEMIDRIRAVEAQTLSQLGWLDTFHDKMATVNGSDEILTAVVAVARAAAAQHAEDLAVDERLAGEHDRSETAVPTDAGAESSPVDR